MDLEKMKDEKSAAKESILQQLRQRGCRITKQREILVDVILSEQCQSCKEIYYLAAKADPDIGMATVYRMMNVLEEIGALKRRNEYRICDKEKASSAKWVVEFSDDSRMEMKDEAFRNILECGLDIRGHLKGRDIKRVILQT